jgi:sucrose phosphorylase
MAQRVQALGGFVSYRSNSDGTQSPYELNISYLDALGDPDREEDNDTRARRFLAAQAIMLALQGVPGIYFHSLFGSENWSEGVAMTGQKRSINRQKLERDRLQAELADPGSIRAQVHYPYVQMLAARRAEPAFHPNGGQQILFLHEAVFALWRHNVDGSRHVLCLHNVSANEVALDVPLDDGMVTGEPFIDLLSGEPAVSDGSVLRLQLPPYGVRWFGLS